MSTQVASQGQRTSEPTGQQANVNLAALTQRLSSRFSILTFSAESCDDNHDLVEAIGALSPLTARPSRVTFAGTFNAGKSTLVNALLGQTLLSSGNLPETGVLCELRAGDDTTALLIPRDGVARRIPANPAGINQAVGRYLDDGQQNEALASAAKLELTVADSCLGHAVTWVDTPGIDDQRALDDLLRAELRHTDLLVWVLPSRQMLSITEAEFLAEFMAVHGPDAVVLVLNAFLPVDSPEAWREFGERLPDYLAWLRKGWKDLGQGDAPMPPVMPVSARAALDGDPALFGITALRDLIEERSNPHHPARLRHACFTAATGLEALANGRIAELAAKHEQKLAREAVTVLAKNAARKRLHHFNRETQAAVDRFVERATAAVTAARPNALTPVALADPKSLLLAFYGKATTEIGGSLETLLGEMNDAAQSATVKLTPATASEIIELLALPGVDAVVAPPTESGGMSKAIATGAAAGFAAGVVLPVVGNAAGAAVGAAWGFFKSLGKPATADPAAVSAAIASLADKLTNAVTGSKPAIVARFEQPVPREAKVRNSVQRKVEEVATVKRQTLALAADLMDVAREGRVG